MRPPSPPTAALSVCLRWVRLDWVRLDWVRLCWVRLCWGQLGWGRLGWVRLGWVCLGWVCLGWPAAAAGNGDTRLVVEAMEYPWSAVGRVNTGGRGHCTGFLIGPRHALTAAHCLYDAVEGRWRGPNELHFVAGYQRDRYLIHAAVAGYARSSAFDATIETSAAGTRLDNVVADWAVLTLAEPIGRQAGWLGLGVLDEATIAEIRAGRAQLAQAGYRRGQAHAMTASAPCRFLRRFQGARGLANSCVVFHGDSGAPLLLFHGRRAYGVALQVARIERGGETFAGAVSLAALGRGAKVTGDAHPAPGFPPAAGAPWRAGSPPPAGSPADPLPHGTIDILLVRLGYLEQDGAKADRAAAIRRFESAAGLPETGAASLALLGRLLAANGE